MKKEKTKQHTQGVLATDWWSNDSQDLSDSKTLVPSVPHFSS